MSLSCWFLPILQSKKMAFNNHIYENVTYIDNGNNDNVSTILHIIVQIVFFGLGLILQVKIILNERKEKGSTWQIHISHSVVLIIAYAFTIPFESLIYFAPFMSSYTGTWLCYIASFVILYCFHAILSHSLLVAVMKFAFIVHFKKVREFGDIKAQQIFLWINLCFPMIWTALMFVTSERMKWPSLNTCFQHREQLRVQYDTTFRNITEFLVCEFGHEVESGGHAYILYIIGRCFCLFTMIGNGLIASNLPEAFFYHRIFRKMRG